MNALPNGTVPELKTKQCSTKKSYTTQQYQIPHRKQSQQYKQSKRQHRIQAARIFYNAQSHSSIGHIFEKLKINIYNDKNFTHVLEKPSFRGSDEEKCIYFAQFCEEKFRMPLQVTLKHLLPENS